MANGEHNLPASREAASAPSMFRPRTLLLAALALVVGYACTGFYVVDTDEQGVIRRFGDIAARVGPGMHYRLPWPIDRVDVLKTTRVTKTGVGFALPEDEREVVLGIELLTGDTNIIGLALILQYIVDDPADYLFRTEDPQALVGVLAEAELTEAVLAMPVDTVLTTGRLPIQEQVKTGTQEILDRYRSGVRLTSANIMTITLDKSVAEAFQTVADAMADREKFRNEARTYANNTIPKSRGRAHALVREAQAYKEQRVAEAIGNSERFLTLLDEYRKAEDITRARLYLEAMEEILPKVKLYVIDSEDGEVPVNLRLTNQ